MFMTSFQHVFLAEKSVIEIHHKHSLFCWLFVYYDTTQCFESELLSSSGDRLKMKAICFQNVVLHVLYSVTMEKFLTHISDILHVTPLSKN
jgi:hypothetical protein